MQRIVRTWPWEPALVVYGWREDAYPPDARADFADRILSDMSRFLAEQVRLEGSLAADNSRRPTLRVFWREGAHEVTVSEE